MKYIKSLAVGWSNTNGNQTDNFTTHLRISFREIFRKHKKTNKMNEANGNEYAYSKFFSLAFEVQTLIKFVKIMNICKLFCLFCT